VRLISWNIQWCRGVDGRVDPARIARIARALGEPEVCCFQEVAENFATLEGSAGEKQAEILHGHFEGYSAHFACAVDVPDGTGGRRRYGNLILSRLPVQQVFRHSLPWPADSGVPSMPRVALEAVVQAPWGPVSVTTTHLEYYSTSQRAAQVERLRELDVERQRHEQAVPHDAEASAVFRHWPRPAASILTGDFNMPPGDPLVARLRQSWRDAWELAHPQVAHPPTFLVHDRKDGTPPYYCDYVFVSENLAARVSKVTVDADTQASDHQPVIVEFR